MLSKCGRLSQAARAFRTASRAARPCSSAPLPAAQRSRGPLEQSRSSSSSSSSSSSFGAAAAMPLSYPPPIVLNPPSGAAPSATVIFLHGLGDTGHGWSEIAPEFQAGKLGHVRFIFPNAPRRPITLNFGMAMPGWYDIASLEDINQQEDDEGLKESMRYIEDLVAKELASGIPSTRCVVGGFSQGGAVALLMLRSKTKLAAIVGLSTYLPLAGEAEVLSAENKSTPVLMCHGDADNVVAYQFGRASHSKLTSLGGDVDFATYAGLPHSASPREIQDVQEFLAKHLPPL